MNDDDDPNEVRGAGHTWLKIEAGMLSHPKIVEAGGDGFALFVALLCLTKLHGRNGQLGPRFASPRYLAYALPGWAHDRIVAALRACVNAGLLDERDDGGFIIPGWLQYQRDPTAPERAARAREKKEALEVSGRSSVPESRRVTHRNAPVRTVTGDGTGRDGTGEYFSSPSGPTGDRGTDEERRSEEAEPKGETSEGAGAAAVRAEKAAKPKPPPNPDVRTLADAWFAEWARHDREVKPSWGQAEGAQAKHLLTRAPLAVIVATMPGYWREKFRTYTTHRGFVDFASKFDAVRAAMNGGPPPREPARERGPPPIRYERLTEPERK